MRWCLEAARGKETDLPLEISGDNTVSLTPLFQSHDSQSIPLTARAVKGVHCFKQLKDANLL